MHTGSLAVLLIFGFPIVLVGGFFLIWILKIMQGGASRQERQVQAEETRLIQELHQGLIRMEQRIETLETLLLDPNARAQGSNRKDTL